MEESEKRENSCSNLESYSYVYVGNIPLQYHSVDLRAYFSQFIEGGAFKCFHFKHRPENFPRQQQIDGKPEERDREAKKSTSHLENAHDSSDKLSFVDDRETLCAVVQIYNKYVPEIVTKCRESPWYNKDGQLLGQAIKPHFLKIKVISNESGPFLDSKYQTRKERKPKEMDFSKILDENDLLNLIELHPPPAMPHGNVGTSMNKLMDSIRNCKLPSSVIQKLGLTFSKSYSKRLYGSIPYSYGTEEYKGVQFESSDKAVNEPKKLVDKSKQQEIHDKEKHQGDDARSVSPVPKDDFGEEDGAEDWERHETLNDDLSRAKERLFEEDIELKWEKGGSGLVFYTDAYYWHEMKGKDFDEDTTDDWDIDTSIYYGNAGDRASCDLLEMREGQAIREGRLSNKTQRKKYDGHFGRRLLERQGWVKGTGLGSQRSGIVDPIEADGQSSRDKRGLGYFGEKLNRHVKAPKRRAENDVIIGTCYDDKCEIEKKWRTPALLEIKYRPPSIGFSPAKK